MEIWKDIIGYEGLYKISNYGNIKSMPKSWVCGRSSVRFKEETILMVCKTTMYHNVNLHKEKSAKFHNIHRLLAEHFIPNPENKREVNHINGDKHDNRLDNLEWVTSSENRKHAYDIGLKTTFVGGKHWNSKPIMAIDANCMRTLSFPCISSASQKLKIGESRIRHIIKGRVKSREYKFEYV